jgi:hypothetical protein
MNREQVINELQAAAAQNGGKAPGERAFQSATGVTRRDFWKAGFSRYGEAVTAAGLTPNVLWSAPDASTLLDAVLDLAMEKERCPTTGELRVAQEEDKTFPSESSIRTLIRSRGMSLSALLLDHARSRGFEELVRILQPDVDRVAAVSRPSTVNGPKVKGYVYLVRHDRDYKIGRSNDVARRRREIALLLPQDVEHVHIIETDDPEGIEHYWHERFKAAGRHLKGEWYRLTTEDVAAFKRRRYQ